MSSLENYLQENDERWLEELLELLRIPSISAVPESAPDVQRAAEWVAAKLKAIGIEHTEVMPTGGHPIVYGDWLHAEDKPTVLIYGHFDTQPVDPIDLWITPPFEPTIENGRIRARGASDDKGNLFVAIMAVEALLSRGSLPVNVKFFFEGQEEIGSPQLPEFVMSHKELLACDLVLNADSGQWSETAGSLLVGLRGMCALEIDMVGPSHDLHSGGFGGAVQNPLHAMVMLLDSMRGHDGRILVDGFYENVAPMSDVERAEVARIPVDEEAYKAAIGVTELFGEPGYTTYERTSVRPTLEVNGLWGGFTGAGGKTVLPSEAHVKITCRLVPDQDPARIIDLIKAHIAGNIPPGVKVTVKAKHGAPAYSMPLDHPAMAAATEVLTEIYGQPPYATRSGGSIPVTTLFQRALGVYSLGFGFGLEDELIHSPNEFFRLSSIAKGRKAWAMLMQKLGE